MAFPVVAGSTTGTSSTVTLPSSIAAGDLLLILVYGLSAPSTPSGWTSIAATPNDYAYFAAFTKIAAGGETTAAVGGGAVVRTIALRITGHGGSTAITYETSSIDPPSVTAPWGSGDNLFMALCALVDAAPSGNPANYGSQIAVFSDNWGIRVVRRELASASDDPAAFTASGYEAAFTATLAIQPGGSASVEGTANFTEPNESLSATATNLATGSASFTEPNETLSAAASHPVLGEAEFTEPNETLSSTVAGATFANAAFTEPNETIEAEASHPVVGNAAFTEDGETLEGAASNPIAASAIITEPVESLSAAAGVAVVADADFTEPDETVGATVDAGGGGFGRSYLRQINIGRVGIGL